MDANCQANYYRSFWYIFGLIVDGSLVPIIVRLTSPFCAPIIQLYLYSQAIYPTIIIILVALNRSHMESGLIKATESSLSATVPLRQLTITVDTAVTTRCDMGRQSGSETVLAIREETFAPED